MSLTSSDEQFWGERTLETYEICRRIYYAVDCGDRLLDDLHRIKKALAELDERVADLKRSYWPTDKNK